MAPVRPQATNYAPGYFTELVRAHHFPPMFTPQPGPKISEALKASQAANLARGRINPKGRK